MFRAENVPGRKSAGFPSGSVNIGPPAGLQPAEGPKGPFYNFLDKNPAQIRPGSPISDSEALLLNIDYRCVPNIYRPTPDEFIGFGAMDHGAWMSLTPETLSGACHNPRLCTPYAHVHAK